RYAQQRAEALPGPRAYLATAQAFDREMELRIARHQAERGPEWAATIEEPLDPGVALAEAGGRFETVLVDCVTLWLSNLMGRGDDDEAILAAVAELGRSFSRTAANVVIVTNEVGLGLVPEHPLGRRFRDLAGFANQELARACDEVFFTVWGLPQRLK
ncbi:MAG: bifunctional adenosylcobinamide kinase/adenosylcobinamide-phosphate guanylyltransferase, partial [Deltaproteobacteria bacterium]|nr:bifunctional adenosylcobinamide kinase/adenosylcobinamide-phosphate guanylyltransferase [Deltaproteobacteria bacterium]